MTMLRGNWFGWLALVFVSSALVASCADSRRNQATTAGAGGAASAQAVDGGAGEPAPKGLPSGQDDEAGGAGQAASAGGADARSPLPERPDPAARLGQACDRDASCGGEGLRCLRADRDDVSVVGTPSGGLCTAECETDADCSGFDRGAICATLDEVPIMIRTAAEPSRRFCMQGCSFGVPAGAAKCHGRAELACRPFATVPTTTCDIGDECPSGTFCFRGACRKAACGPRCNVNSDCEPGRACDANTGLCTEESLTDVPLGGECPGDTDPESTACEHGTCLVLFDDDGRMLKRQCTQTCTLGQQCGADGACVMPRLRDYAAGDIGYCLQRCDCDGDCRNPTDRCASWATDGLATHFESRGFCLDAGYGVEGLRCDDGEGAGGASSDGSQGGAAGEAVSPGGATQG